jgi:hypothetical protein
MNDQHDDRNAAELERRARDAFNDSVDGLDSATLSRLNRSRQRALAAAAGRDRTGLRWKLWAPAGALAAGVLAAVLFTQSPTRTGLPAPVAATATGTDVQQDPLELLTAGEDLDLAAEADLEFYAWVELETAGDDDGVG